jgi:hypothetical protein
MEQARASMDYLVDLAEALQRQISVFQLRDETRGPMPPQAARASTPLAAPQAPPQAAPLMGRLHLPDGVAPTMPPARRADAMEPATQPMATASAPRLPQPQGPSVRALLQETTPALGVARGERSRPLPPGAASSPSERLLAGSGELGASRGASRLSSSGPGPDSSLGSGGLGSSQRQRSPYLTPRLANDPQAEQAGQAGRGDEADDEG